MSDEMTSSRPYLLRALYDWIVDNGLTPHILVDAAEEDTQVPLEYVQDQKIVLNINPSAVQALSMDNDAVAFTARFSGAPRQIYVPIIRVLAIYARENGQGMMFADEDDLPPPSGPDAGGDQPGASGGSRPSLKVVK